MALTVGELILKMDAQGKAQVISALSEVEVQVNKTSQKFQQLSEVVNRVGLVVSAYLTASVYKFTQYTDEMDKIAKTTGASVDKVQELAYAIEQEHGNVGDLTVGLRNLSRVMNTGADETGKQVQAIKELGLQTTTSNGQLKNSIDFMLEIAEKFKGMTNETQKSAYAIQLFGRSGTQLVPFLNLGAAGIGQLMEKAKELGIVLDQKTITAGKEFRDTLNDVKLALMSVSFQIANSMLPILNSLAMNIVAATQILRQLPDTIKIVGIAVAGLISIISSLTIALRMLGITSLGLTSILAGIGPVGWAIIGVMTALGAVIGKANLELGKMVQSAKEFATMGAMQGALNSLKMQLDIVNQKIAEQSEKLQNLALAHKKDTDEYKRINESLQKHIEARDRINKLIDETTVKTTKEAKTINDIIEAIKKEITSIDLLNAANLVAERLGFSLNNIGNQSITIKRRFITLLDEEIKKQKELIQAKKTAYEDLDKKFPVWTQNEEDFLNHMRNTMKLMDDEMHTLPAAIDNVGEALGKLKTDYIDKVYAALGEGIKQLGAVFINIIGSMFNRKLHDDINRVKQAMDALKRAGKENTQEYIQLNDQLSQLSKQTPGGLLKNWFIELAKRVATLIAELLILAGVIALLEALGIPAGALVKILGGQGVGGFDNPSNDMWARKQGSDFGYNFNQGMESRVGAPPSQSQIQVIVHNANPETYVEILSRLNTSQKQILYERAVRPGQLRFDTR